MTLTVEDFLAVDFVALISAVLVALTCGLLGNFLILRRMSLMGDAISHAVLPGIVAAFLITASRAPLPVFLGATASGLATVGLVELVRRVGRVEPGAAMGVVFSVLFALGVFIMARGGADAVDLDPGCVLYGTLETLAWHGAPERFVDLLSLESWSGVPRQLRVQAVTLLVVVVFIVALFKELRVAAFDAQTAATQGINPTLMHYLLMVVVAGAAVASFEAVGSILVIAMLICPAATARMLTERLVPQVLVSAIIAILTGLVGYTMAVFVPIAMGWSVTPSVAGMMTVTAGVFVVLSIVLSPTRGILAKQLRRRRLARRVALEDLLARVYRAYEQGISELALDQAIRHARGSHPAGIRRAARAGLVRVADGQVLLTERGIQAARQIVRQHRLWESYLVERVGVRPDHVHESAEWLEHIRLEDEPPMPDQHRDPHGRPIPPEEPRETT